MAKSQQQEASLEIEATVAKIHGEGRSRFFIAYPTHNHQYGVTKDTPITCSLSNWSGEFDPLKSQMVMLKEIQLFVRGWRARFARPIQLNGNSKQQGASNE